MPCYDEAGLSASPRPGRPSRPVVMRARLRQSWLLPLLLLVFGGRDAFCAPLARAGKAAPASPALPADLHSEFLVNVWQTSDGLPINVLQDIQQTPDGYLWIGTSQGLARFDGTRFDLFFGIPEGLRYGSRCWPLQLDQRGRLWVGTDQVGVAVLETNGFFEVLTNNVLTARAESLCPDSHSAMFWVDALGAYGKVSSDTFEPAEGFLGKVPGVSKWIRERDGTMWLQTPRWLRVLTDGRLRNFDQRGGPTIVAAPRTAGGLWVASQGRLNIVRKDSTNHVVAPFPWLGEGNRATTMLEDKPGRLWLGTATQGLFCYENGQFRHVLPIASAILCLYEDMHGSIWAGTRGGGLIQIRQRQFFVHDLRSGLANEFVNSLCEDSTGRMWIASAEGHLGWWKDATWHMAGPREQWPPAEPVAVAPARDGGVFVSTAGRQIFRFADDRFTEVTLPPGGLKGIAADLLHDSQGRLWMVTDNDGILCYDGTALHAFSMSDGLPSNYMRRILEDENGTIYAGDWEGAIVRLDADRWLTVRERSGHRDAVRSMIVADGTIWVGTSAGGLLRVRGGRTTRVSVEEGLPDVCIQQLLLDGHGSLWGGTPHKLFKLSLKQLDDVMAGRADQLQPISYGLGDGLPATSFGAWNDPRSWRRSNGELWFATANGAIHFNPATLAESKPPRAIIEQILVNGRRIHRDELQHLRSGSRVEFKFAAPCLLSPDRVRFRYMLSGIDTDWVYAEEARSATYASLPPGEHVFKVVASSPEGLWGESAAVQPLKAHPFFWQTNWFWALVAAALAGTSVWLLRRAAVHRLQRRIERMRHEQVVHRERARIAKDIHDELGANLTSIGLMAEMGGRHKADATAIGHEFRQISETARESVAAMDAIVWALNPGNDSLDHFANYLAQFTREFFRPTALRTRLELPADLPAEPMGTELRHQMLLIVKECYNNIVRHAQAQEVRLELAFEHHQLRMCIADDGKGIDGTASAEGQDGLRNLDSRIRALGGSMSVQTDSSGTRFEFIVPFEKVKL